MTSAQANLSLIDVPVGRVMTKKVWTIEGSMRLVDCVSMMKGADVGCLVVVEQGRPIGIFTERDLVRKIAEGPESLGLSMAQVMSTPLTTVAPGTTIWDAITLMGRLNIRRLPVVESGKLVGILTEKDILRLVVSQQSLLLESVSESILSTTRDQLKEIIGRLGVERPPTRAENAWQ
jgi:CBS domain-containing protein